MNFNTKKKKTKSPTSEPLYKKLIWWSGLFCICVLICCGLSTFVTPARFPLLGVFVLGFPFYLVASLFFVLLALLLRVEKSWWLLIGLLANAWAVRIYFPINLPKDNSAEDLKVLSYNVQNYMHSKDEPVYGQAISNYLADSQADIICLQEAPHHDKRYFESILPILHRAYAYTDSVEMEKSSYLNIFSKLPILSSEIVANGEFNHCAAFTLLDGQDTLYVVNCHLRSMRLTPDDKAGFSSLVHDSETLSDSDKRREGRMLISKISSASVKRAEQVDQLCEYLTRQAGKRIILCGDFNDTPISYAHNRISTFLKDCYAATATGFGRSFNSNSMLVRIDHIFCSSHFHPLSCTIDQRFLYSDHYPIICTFERKPRANE